MAAESPNRWNLLRMLSRCAYRQAQAANNVSGTTPIPANATVTPTSILEGIQAGNFSAQITDGKILISLTANTFFCLHFSAVTNFPFVPLVFPRLPLGFASIREIRG
jgi:hypothetical protein